MAFSADTTLGELLESDAAKAVLEKHLPGISTNPQIGMARGFSLRMVAGFSAGKITPDTLDNIDRELKSI